MSKYTKEIEKRRTFAIISHPDAGKTTLTEKFLLYGGAINLAGSVKGKATARHAVSDWMEIEKERGISVTSSVLQFHYDGYCINILDTPGHQDFSEDTYRTLMAADSAVMVIDGSKGVEAQTRKLFKVCVMRHIPIFTFMMPTIPLIFLTRSKKSLESQPALLTGQSVPVRNSAVFTTATRIRSLLSQIPRKVPRRELLRKSIWILLMHLRLWIRSRKHSFWRKSSFWMAQVPSSIRRW